MPRITRIAGLAGALLAVSMLVTPPVAEAKSGHGDWRGNYHGHYYGHWRGYPGYWGGGWGLGLGTGLLLGSAWVPPRYYYAPRPYYWPGYYYASPYYAPRHYAPHRYYGSRIAYCRARFRSYNVTTRTYMGYDGRRHYC